MQSRRRAQVWRGTEWVRPYNLAQRALDNAASLILSAIHLVMKAGRCAETPIWSTKILIAALRQVTSARKQLDVARQYLAEAFEVLGRTPPELWNGEAPELLAETHERCETVQHYIYVAAQEVLLGHEEIFNGVVSGELVPEDPSQVRPHRRVIRHRPLFVRAFLSARRQPRVGDRITPILLRRKRTPRPAEVQVPRRHLRGRAPPLSSTCSL